MSYIRLILVVLSLQLCAVLAKVDYLDKGQISSLKKGSWVVITVTDKDDSRLPNAISSLKKVEKTLDNFDINTALLDCKMFSKVKHCRDSSQMVLMLEDNDSINDLELDQLQDDVTALALILHQVFPDLLGEINSEDDIKQLKKMDGTAYMFNIELGTKEHSDILMNLYQLDEQQPKSYWISDVKLLGLNPEEFASTKAFTMECNNMMCSYSGKSVKSLSVENLQELGLQLSQDSSGEMMEEEVDEEPYEGEDKFIYWAKRVKGGDNIFALFAGKGKEEAAMKLAKTIKEKIPCEIKVSLTTDNVAGLLGSYFENDQIFAVYITKKAKKILILTDVGFLKDSSVEEFESMLKKAKMSDDKITTKLDLNYSYQDDELSIVDNLDDPMMFANHNSKMMKNFYLYDYKSMSRLTDKTYPMVTSGDEYAVILVTLEFNPRALGALALYKEIHEELFADGNTEPYMHRLECYDWTFVCQNNNFTTTPRMYFYNPKRGMKMAEYKGMWDKESMKHAIIRNSLDEVMVLESDQDVDLIPDFPLNIVTGVFKNGQGPGVKMFRQAAMEHPEYLFVLAAGQAAKSMQGPDKKVLKDGTIMTVKSFIPMDKLSMYEKADDIAMFAKRSFQPTYGKLFELSIKNYNEVMKCSMPLVIYFNDGNKDTMETMKMVGIDDKIVNDYRVSWMSAAKNTVGYFVAKKYNTLDVKPPMIAFNNKKEVWVKSIKNSNKQEIIDWILACKAGKGKSSYVLPEEEWMPRLEGYDFLQKLRDENKFPYKFRQTKMKEDKEEPAGNRLKSHKKMMKEDVEMKMKQGKPSHNEL